MEKQEKKVVIAMSGGVDSSVAAALLVEQGYSVTGMMLKLWSDDECGEAENACCPPEAIDQACRVANIIGIPFYVLDVRNLFKQMVVDQFIEAYRSGFTPNPCYSCNRNIRWGFFLNRVLDAGNDLFATGHYAKVEFSENKYWLKKGVDPLKDQSYVLSGLNQFQLSHTILPLEHFHKTQTREMARNLGLAVADKKDSQDLCFVGKLGYRDFLLRHSPDSFSSGNIRSLDGKIYGQHKGLVNYTIGQRKGLGSGNAEPIYVVEKKIDTNELVIGSESELGKNQFFATGLNWILGDEPEYPLQCEVKIRYNSKPVPTNIQPGTANTVIVQFDTLLRDITPGQIAVFYQNDMVIGSGMIQSTSTRGE